jgi:hypothetical protein
MRHRILELVEVERPELLSFGDDHERVGTSGTFVGTGAEFELGHLLQHLHALDRIIGAHFGAQIAQRRDQRDRGRFLRCPARS